MIILNDEGNRLLSLSQSEIISFLFNRGEYKSYFPISARNENEFKGYIGNLNTKAENEIEIEELPQKTDIYICSNGMKTPHKRKRENLINIQNLVIDIDFHKNQIKQKDIQLFKNAIIKECTIKPNLINETGRGIQLWFAIEPCHQSLDKICLSVIDMICQDIQRIIDSSNQKIDLEIDRSSSLKLNGLFRFPFSYNTKSNTWGNAEVIHYEEKNINELRKTLQNKGYKSQYFKDYERKKEKKQKPKQHKFHQKINNNDYTPYLIHRKKFMDHLWKTRNIEIGTRDKMIFATYATLIYLFEESEAREYCEILNDNLKDPLPYGEILSIFKEIEKNHHKFSVQKFFDFIEATPSEIEWYNENKTKEKRKEERKNKKIERNNKVKELYKKGKSITEISKMLEISRPTIYKILENEGD